MMTEEEGVPAEELQHPLSPSLEDPEETAESQTAPTRTEDTKERPAESGAVRFLPSAFVDSSPNLFKTKKFFVLRPGTLNQAIKDIEVLVDKEEDGSVRSVWLMAEVDHWNNEKERIVFITDKTMLVFKYDFIMFNCDQMQRIPLNYIDRITYGKFTFPKRSLLEREGEGVRIYWDRLREPSFVSRWNPFSTDMPYMTFTYHLVRNLGNMFDDVCDIHKFREQLKTAAEKAHAVMPIPGKANGVMSINQSILIEAYVGLMSFLGNENHMGYCMARGNVGF
ncbi:tumor protein p63-regulated gene 1 protein [Pholidichthys leucotaenia]